MSATARNTVGRSEKQWNRCHGPSLRRDDSAKQPREIAACRLRPPATAGFTRALARHRGALEDAMQFRPFMRVVRLLLIGIAAAVTIFAVRSCYPFLAVTHRLNTDSLVVEGWINYFAIDAADCSSRSGTPGNRVPGQLLDPQPAQRATLSVTGHPAPGDGSRVLVCRDRSDRSGAPG